MNSLSTSCWAVRVGSFLRSKKSFVRSKTGWVVDDTVFHVTIQDAVFSGYNMAFGRQWYLRKD